MGKRINTAVWIEKYQRWQIKVQKNGERKTFYSSITGRNGQRECNKKADNWLDSSIKAGIKVNELFAEWLKKVNEQTSYTNYKDRKCHGDTWILPAIGNKKIENVCEQDLQDIVDNAYSEGRSKKTISNIRGTITAFYKFARKSNATQLRPTEIEVNPKAYSKKKKVLDDAAIKTLFSAEQTKDFWYQNAFKFLLLSGLRVGELIGLKKSDIEGNVCHIMRAVNKYKIITGGKTENAQRSFVMTPMLEDVLKSQLQQIDEFNTDYIFPSIRGIQSSQDSIYHQWQRYQEYNSIEPRISIHELRHTFVSMCKDVPLEYLKMQVGHSKEMDTFGQYGHEMDGDLEKSSKLILEALKSHIN